MFHVGIMAEVAAGQRSDRLARAEMARLLKETRLNNPKREARYLRSIHDFLNRLRLSGRERITANKVGLLTQEC